MARQLKRKLVDDLQNEEAKKKKSNTEKFRKSHKCPKCGKILPNLPRHLKNVHYKKKSKEWCKLKAKEIYKLEQELATTKSVNKKEFTNY